MMRHLLTLSLAGLVLFGCRSDSVPPQVLHRHALVADLHSDTPLRMRRGFDIGAAHDPGDGHMDLPRLDSGGVDLQVFACWLPTETPLDSCVAVTNLLIDSLEAQLARNADRVAICRTAAEAEDIIASNRLAAFVGIENGVAIANDLADLRHFYDRGVRYMTLTHTASSDWCISSADTAPAFHGLTDFGRDVVREMNRLGMIVDISHAHTDAVEEVLKITTDPVIASHSCVHALCAHDRNLTDDQIKAIAASGGLIGINFYNGYLSADWNRISDSLWALHEPEYDSLRARYTRTDSLLRADNTLATDTLLLRENLDRNDSLYRDDRRRIWQEISTKVDSLTVVDVGTVCDHIDYIVKLVGPDYVGFGSDYDGVPSMPDGLKDCSGLPHITEELVARGYSRSDIGKILGGNFMRLFRSVCDKTPIAAVDNGQ